MILYKEETEKKRVSGQTWLRRVFGRLLPVGFTGAGSRLIGLVLLVAAGIWLCIGSFVLWIGKMPRIQRLNFGKQYAYRNFYQW